ncbi:barstar family protein [Serratia microhaemolytica]|uniref:barstar family protein n=1 Tax=Serratia microhaemolytica TaxID=2675110 RepID=UPI000FDDAAD6|nr:barstar family protein [Serratia microhaemolytica]
MNKNTVIIDGLYINTESDFHRILSERLDFGSYYGANLDALWDRLSNDVERPVKLVWVNSKLSEQRLGDTFFKIINILERVKVEDIQFNLDDKFEYVLK